jgi:hemin uptake protein HemP
MTDQPLATKDTTQPKLKALSSNALFQGTREVLITHLDEVYRLRITRQNKLILTK